MAAVAFGALGAEGLAFYLLVAAVGTAAIAALESVGTLVDARCSRGPERAAWWRAGLAVAGLVLVVAASAAEAPLLALGTLLTLVLQAIPFGRRAAEPVAAHQAAPAQLSRAA